TVVDEYTLTVRAHIDPLYYEELPSNQMSPLEEEDFKLGFSRCSFFVEGKGCGLNPLYKPSTCRSFICSTIEQELSENQLSELSYRVRQIKQEVQSFERLHKASIQRRKWTLKTNMEQILD